MNTSDDDNTSAPDVAGRVPSGSGRSFAWACGLQGLIVVVVVFGDIGFDVPGRFGLDFGHLLLFAFVDLILIAWCVRVAIKARSWSYAGVQALLLSVAVLSVWAG